MTEQPDYTAAMRAARREQRRWEAALAMMQAWRSRAENDGDAKDLATLAISDADALLAAFERGEDGTR